MSASSWVAVLIAGLGILGTLAATALAQLGEGKRASRARQVEATRRAEDRQDALERERREAIRSDYRGILRFISRTRIFVLEMRARLTKLEDWSAHASSDAREVEDLAYKAWSARGLRTTWSQSSTRSLTLDPRSPGVCRSRCTSRLMVTGSRKVSPTCRDRLRNGFALTHRQPHRPGLSNDSHSAG